MRPLPYSETLGGRDAFAVLSATPAKLDRLLQGLTPEQTEHHPAPDKWSLQEVMCHMADCEIAWSWRLRIAYEKDNPTLQPFDQDPWARIYGSYTFEQARSTFAALRAWNLTFLGGLSDADKQRPISHPENGPMTLWSVAEIAAGHDLHHLAALEKQLAAR